MVGHDIIPASTAKNSHDHNSRCATFQESKYNTPCRGETSLTLVSPAVSTSSGKQFSTHSGYSQLSVTSSNQMNR
jgi:hypothetical protein